MKEKQGFPENGTIFNLKYICNAHYSHHFFKILVKKHEK